MHFAYPLVRARVLRFAYEGLNVHGFRICRLTALDCALHAFYALTISLDLITSTRSGVKSDKKGTKKEKTIPITEVLPKKSIILRKVIFDFFTPTSSPPNF